MNLPRSKLSALSRRGFSLVEVVVAVGIFAIAIVSVIGLVSAIGKSVADIKDGDDASRVVSNLQSKLQGVGFTALRAYMGDVTAKAENVRYYASRDGSKIGAGGDSSGVWDPNSELSVAEENALKYFLIELLPNDTLSPPGAANDAAAGYLAFTVRLIYPAYLGDGTRVLDNSQQSSLLTPVAVTR